MTPFLGLVGEKMTENTPLTFTSAEQIDLANLSDNARKFKNLSLLLQNNLFKGGEAQAVVESLSIVQSLYNQAEQQVAQIKQIAQKRIAAPTVKADGVDITADVASKRARPRAVKSIDTVQEAQA